MLNRQPIIHDFETRINRSLAEDCGVSPDHRIAVALSGGADSVALLCALHRLGRRPVALHCNFHLRGDESDGDALFCRQLCGRLGIELHCADFQTTEEAAGGESVEMACRRLRYGWFAEMLDAHGLDRLALAHHYEDSVETLFINLLRGSGTDGLCGIRPVSNLDPRNIRPMLAITRPEIEAYLEALGQDFRVDSSNLSNVYKRNALRNVIIPAIREAFPNADAGLRHTMQNMRAASDYARESAALLLPDFCDEGAIVVARVKQQCANPAPMLGRLLKACFGADFSDSQILDMLAVADGASRIFVDKNQFTCELHGGRLSRYVAPEQAVYNFRLVDGLADAPLEIRAEIITKEQFDSMEKPADASAFFLDADLIAPDSLAALRPWREGDRIKPFGVPGSCKLKKLFSDRHLSASQKNLVRVVALGEEILWVPGIRTSRLYAVTPATTRVLMLNLRQK